MKAKEIVAKATASLDPLNQIAGIWGLVIPAPIGLAIAGTNAIIQHFSGPDIDPERDYTQEEIDAKADAAIQGILDRDKDFVKDPVPVSPDPEEGGNDGQD